MVSLQCPLSRQTFLFTSDQPMALERLIEIEKHVTANSPDCPHPPLRDLAFDNNFITGSTPLLMACYFGELASVKRIVKGWGVDVNQAAVYYFDPYTCNSFTINSQYYESRIEKALAIPLFVAASRGHLDIVRYLVDQAGANVSAKTINEANADYNGLSPLYGTVLENSSLHPRFAVDPEDRSPIVCFLLESGADQSTDTNRPSDGNPMWTSRHCGNGAITALVEYGMNVNSCYRSLDEISLLNHCIRNLSLAVVELLVDRGANLHTQDSWGFSPIILAAFFHRWDVLDYLLERNEISRIEKIEALELAGAVILFDTYLTLLFPKGLEYWRRSFHLRRMDTDGCGQIVKNLPKKAGLIIVDRKEWTTLTQLEYITQHRYEQEIQSFLIKLRILSSKSWTAVEGFFSDFRLRWVEKLREQHRFIELLNMLWFMLEVIQNFDARENCLWLTTLDIVECLIETLMCYKMDDSLLNKNTISTSLKLILATDQFHLDDREYIADEIIYNNMNLLFGVIITLADRPQLVNEDIMESLTGLVKRDQRHCPQFDDGGSFLHMACGQFLTINDPRLVIATIRLLLRAGADPNSGYANGNGVFHAMAVASDQGILNASLQESVARLLLCSGAHLDRVNNQRETAADLWMNLKNFPGDKVTTRRSDLPSWLRGDSVPKLECMCATVIRSHGVPYMHFLPPLLHPFVSWH